MTCGGDKEAKSSYLTSSFSRGSTGLASTPSRASGKKMSSREVARPNVACLTSDVTGLTLKKKKKALLLPAVYTLFGEVIRRNLVIIREKHRVVGLCPPWGQCDTDLSTGNSGRN